MTENRVSTAALSTTGETAVKQAHHSELLSRDQIEAQFGLRRGWLEQLAHIGGGPAYLKLGRRMVRYRRSEIERWLTAHEVRHTSCIRPTHANQAHEASRSTVDHTGTGKP